MIAQRLCTGNWVQFVTLVPHLLCLCLILSISECASAITIAQQVFGGQEGNTQADVFKDTKHLIMSVVDGYNVCIFAYGQTGAGKVR